MLIILIPLNAIYEQWLLPLHAIMPYPIGSMYGIYANIWGILMGSMSPYIAYMDTMGIYIYVYIYMMNDPPEFQAQQLRSKTHQPKVGLPGVAWHSAAAIVDGPLRNPRKHQFWMVETW
jgi:hypothetical protein